MDDIRWGSLAAGVLTLLLTSFAWWGHSSLSNMAEEEWSDYRTAVCDLTIATRVPESDIKAILKPTPTPTTATATNDDGPPTDEKAFRANAESRREVLASYFYNTRLRETLIGGGFIEFCLVLLGVAAASINFWMAFNMTECVRAELRDWAVRNHLQEQRRRNLPA